MSCYKFILNKSHQRKDGSFPIIVRITRFRIRRYIPTGLYSQPEQWDDDLQRFVIDKKKVKDFAKRNTLINQLEVKVEDLILELTKKILIGLPKNLNNVF